VTAPSAAVFARPLRLGSQGTDVAALQEALETKGLLSIPPGTVRGYYGLLTKTAVARYQTSVGLPPVGVFGPLTTAKLVGELKEAPSFPNTDTEKTKVAPLV
jgi:peptidoglycan hydrolase-like protein with peptidoglycan-binding domain